MLSFRTRVLVLVVMVAAVATTATAWLTYRIAGVQIAASRETDQKVTDQITRTLVNHAQQHGTWNGLPAVVDELSRSTGKRIDVSTESDTPIGGTQRSPRPGTASVTVDPHPHLLLGEDEAEIWSTVTYQELGFFRSSMRLAQCLAARGTGVTLTLDRNGVPRAVGSTGATPGGPESSNDCRTKATSTDDERNKDFAAVNACSPGGTAQRAGANCLREAFHDRISNVGPETVRVSIGALGDTGLPAGPVVAVVALVMVCAAVGSAVVSRRTLRPITALTGAAQRIGTGAGWAQVEVSGNDEVAELTRTFNMMAASLQRGEERQRRMVADVAHELRTPLSTVRSYLEGLIDGVVPAGPELFVSLHDEAMLQQRIVDDLQDLAQAEAGSLTYRKDRLDVRELLEVSRTALAVKADAGGIRLAVEGTGDLEVHADPDRIRQVIGNLVSNALRYTPSGGSIILSCRASGDRVIVEVADTGCGISADDLPHVFDRFWRADASRGRTTGGSGLGLAIAQQIVADHGGDMAVRSRVGQGTTFTVRLPLVEHAPYAAPLPAGNPAVPADH